MHAWPTPYLACRRALPLALPRFPDVQRRRSGMRPETIVVFCCSHDAAARTPPLAMPLYAFRSCQLPWAWERLANRREL